MVPPPSLPCAMPQVLLSHLMMPSLLPSELHQAQLHHFHQYMLALLQSTSSVAQAPPQLPRPKQHQPQQHPNGASKKQHRTHVDEADLARAVASLYQDELKPYGRILRKRLSEMAHVAGNESSGDVSTPELREVIDSCPWLYTEGVDGADWAALLVGQPQSFVDVYSAEDLYPPEMWVQAAKYFDALDESNMVLPGGRYSCAQVLAQRSLPWLSGRSLGQICHIVQLAISHKKLLGYLHGRVVPYNRSQSMIKELHAESQEPCGSASMHSVATWDMVRQGLQHFFENMTHGERSIPLSNLKRLFRAQFTVELSETALGYAKLSELLQDPRLVDLCEIKLQGHGYVMVPAVQRAPRNVISLSESLQTASTAPVPSVTLNEPVLPTGRLLRERARFVPPLSIDDIVLRQPSPKTTPLSQAPSDMSPEDFPLLAPMLAPLPADSLTTSLPRLLGSKNPVGFAANDVLKPRIAAAVPKDANPEIVLPCIDLASADEKWSSRAGFASASPELTQACC